MSTPDDTPATTPAHDPEPSWLEREREVRPPRGGAGAWLGLMALLVGGLALMGTGVSREEGPLFAAGLLLATLAFAVPLQLLGRAER
jgi:predicted lipid-binding transport protein (Tim44 family)